MPKTPKRPRDVSQLAKRIVDLSTGQMEEDAPPSLASERAAKGGRARAKNLSPKKKKAIARKAARKRWDNPG